MNPAYEPVALGHTILALLFYLFMIGFMLYSALAIYALMRFGKSKTLGAAVSLTYVVIIAGFFTAAVINLNNVKF
jgi:hypothetical protein